LLKLGQTTNGEEMPGKKSATGGGMATIITMLMAATAFKKKELPKLKSAGLDAPPSKTQIRDWIRVARQVCRSEGIEWIIRMAEAMKLDEDTQEYFLDDPDDSNNAVALEEKKIDMHDAKNRGPVGLLIILMHHYGAGSVLAQYESLAKGESYTWTMISKDWASVAQDIHQFNTQMATALMEANMPDVNERINRHYGSDVHPLSGLLAWKMLYDEQERDASENVAAWMVRIHCIVQEGGKIERPAALMPWVRAIDTAADMLLHLKVGADQIASMTMHVVLETITSKHGEKWEPWRATARELQREIGTPKSKTYTWRIVSAKIKTAWKKLYGDEGISELTQVTTAPGNHRKRGINASGRSPAGSGR